MRLDSTVAQELAAAGMEAAASHANKLQRGWVEQSTVLFKLYARMHPQGFMTEDVREWSIKIGCGSPPDNRAWGAVAKRLLNEGFIEACGYGKQKSTTCHGSPKTIWKKKT